MGGTIAKLHRQGHYVHLIDMTNGEPTPRGSVETRAAEAAAAARVMGVERTLLGLKNREVVHDLPSRHKLAALIRVHRPDWLFLPYPVDAHPDHVAVTRVGRARCDASHRASDARSERTREDRDPFGRRSDPGLRGVPLGRGRPLPSLASHRARAWRGGAVAV